MKNDHYLAAETCYTPTVAFGRIISSFAPIGSRNWLPLNRKRLLPHYALPVVATTEFLIGPDWTMKIDICHALDSNWYGDTPLSPPFSLFFFF